MTRNKTLRSTSLTLAAGVLSLAGSMAHAQYTVGDREISGSLCVGIDCVNGESFGFDTIKLKENNLRIKFQDTSSTASFPTQDWQITANDSSNGGANKFSIDAISPASGTPFTIEAGAPSHSLYVEDGGRIGLGTNTPAVQLHVKDGNTPTLRLEQDGTSGFTARTWDVAGNEANFFIRDVTGGSALPFRIFPGAPTSALTIEGTTGDIGIGTTSPDGPLHINKDSAYITLGDKNDNDKWFFTHQAANDGSFEITNELNGSGVFTLALALQPDGDMSIDGDMAIGAGVDASAAPAAVSNRATIFVDTADGDLKIRFPNGTLRTIASD